MALILADRVRENTTVQGTNSATLLGSPIGFETFSASIGDGNTTYYTIAEKTGDNWEVGVGTYRSAGNLLERTTVLSSSNGGNKVAFAAGDKDVFVTLPAEKVVSTDAAGTMAYQNANAVAITGGAIDGTTIGSTTPAAATFTTLIGGKDQANYGQLTGGATTKAVEFKTLGSDTNIACAIRSKGTGAIDLAAGSSGVNISNGGTVTAITRTASGGGYTSFPTIAVSAPTTAGGVQATASLTMAADSGTAVTPASGGTGYTLNDVLTVVGGTFTQAAQFTVTGVSGGVVTQVTRSNTNFGVYSVLPTSPVATTGGTGTGCTLNMLWQVLPPTITNAGSGYVEQPTVTFSGGGGSGAAAYATVGSGVPVKWLGGTLTMSGSSGDVFRIYDYAGQAGIGVRGHTLTGSAPAIFPTPSNGSQTSLNFQVSSYGTGSIQFSTGGGLSASGMFNQIDQLRVSHTASAVNYVQVTGAATGAAPVISPQGSDTNIHLDLQSKGSGQIRLAPSGTLRMTVQNTSAQCDFSISGGVPAWRTTAIANQVNYLSTTGSISGAGSLALTANGADTNIDLALTPKGTGLVRFGTYTAGVLTPAGYITVKDSAGNTRRLLVG